MVNYVCRTCLYVCDNEFSFRRLEKVKQVLELFVPEIRSFVGKYSLICEQCYYFLKNVEKFKIKCIETQKKLCSMNIETIKDAHNTVLQSVTNEVPIKRFKPYYASSTITSENNNTFPNILNTSAKPVPPIHEEINKKNETLVLNTSVADDLLQLLDHKDDVMDLKSFRKFAVKGIVSNKESEETSNNNDIKESSAELVLNYDEDEYMTRSDLVSAGILSDDSNNSVDKEDPNSEDDSEIVAIEISDDNESDDNVKRVEIKISDSCKERQSDSQIKKQGAVLSSTENEFMSVPIPMTATVKKELKEDENPGFFNKQSTDGYYKCRLCDKRYKTSKGLYGHTKNIHGSEVKLHHCEYCSFFTLWKSALVRHYSIFHMEAISRKYPTPLSKCYHCSYQTRSKQELSRHIEDNHVYNKFIRCSLCRSRFSDNIAFAEHLDKEHTSVDTQFSKDTHQEDIPGNHRMTLTSSPKDSVIKMICLKCDKIFNSPNEYKEHQIKVHGVLAS